MRFRNELKVVAQPLAVFHLTRPGSLVSDTPTTRQIEIACDLIERSLGGAREQGRLDKFKPCAAFYLRRQIRTCLFEYRLAGVTRDIIAKFDELFPPAYKLFIKLLTRFPRATAVGCHAISRIVRSFKLRRRLVNPPRK